MKKIFYFLILVPFSFLGQTATENYIKTTTYKKATSQGSVDVNNPSDATINITYFDGLGRPIQKIAHKQSGTGNDFVNHIQYDAFGNQIKEFLPIASSQSLNYRTIDSTAVTSYYATAAFPTMETTANPFSQKKFEHSPLNRILKQSAPGNDWAMGNGHEIRFDYQSNIAIDSVRLYRAQTSWNPNLGLYGINLLLDGYYADNQLFKTITKNENWTSGNLNTTLEFKDKDGRVILKRCYAYNNKGIIDRHDTYYVYDIYGNLTYVIPPAAGDITITGVLDELCYQYKYDSRNRLVEKKLPGKQVEFIVYDKLDRVVMTGPCKPPFRHLTNDGWMFTKYDKFNRVVMTGWMTSASTINSDQRKIKQDERDTQTVFSEDRLASGTSPSIAPSSANNPVHSYSNLALPTTGYYILSINYYDDYSYTDAPTSFADVENQPVINNTSTIKPKGLLTGKWVKVLDLTTSQASSKKETSYTLYDFRARPVRYFIKNHESSVGWTQTDTRLDFEGKTINTVVSHRRTANPGANDIVTAADNFTYTDQSRLVSHTKSVNGGQSQLIAENSYDDLGQLISKKVGNTASSPLQKVDYNYNIRGWLKNINNDSSDNIILNTSENDLFSFKINYNTLQDNTNFSGTKMFNGNISQTYWRSVTDNNLRKYEYHYDGLSRLTDAIYSKPESIQPDVSTYNEGLKYDKNGNITYLRRYGGVDGVMPEQKIDELDYFYDNNGLSNRLLKVTDATNSTSGFADGANSGNDYYYDNYGNMIADYNKGIYGIRYNHLNLPMEITFANNDIISYVYDGEGKKLEKSVTQGTTTTTTKYIESFQYKKIGSATDVLQFFPTTEGYVKKIGTNSYGYVFNYLDHLGNVRLSYQDLNANGTISTNEILEENHYYPFGLKHSYTNTVVSDYKYKYNSKEWQDELGLNMYDYGARNYDPAIGRWMNIDKMAEKYQYSSPYVYTLNNPIFFIDPDGNEIKIGENIYSYEKDRKYDDITDKFERETYMALDNLYSSGAMNITIGEGDDAKTVNVMDTIIADKNNTISVKEGKRSGYVAETNELFFNTREGIAFVKDPSKPFDEKNVGFNSPSSSLGHEIIHGYNDFYDPKMADRIADKSTMGQITSQEGDDLSFPNAEEQYTTNLTNQVNNVLKEDQRNNYGIIPFMTNSPTSVQQQTVEPKKIIKTMKNLIIISAFFLVCCKSTNRISIYNYDAKTNEHLITPNNLSLFFEKDNKDVIIFDVNDKVILNEFDNIKESIHLKGISNETINKLGIFYFAFVNEADTIYADYELHYWRYKNKSGFYKSKILEEKIASLKQ